MPTVFITGAGRGLGFNLTKTFVELGYHVIAAIHIKDKKNMQRMRKDFSGQISIIHLDVTKDNSVRKASAKVAKEFPALDIIINNAGIHLDRKPFRSLEQFNLRDVEITMAVNATGPLRVTKYFLPLLEKGEQKILLNISSEAGSISNCWRESEFDYCMSKTALNMQSKLLQNYLKRRGIKVLAIHPGWMRTDMGGQDADLDPSQSAEAIVKLATKNWSPEDGIYFDYRGKPMEW